MLLPFVKLIPRFFSDWRTLHHLLISNFLQMKKIPSTCLVLLLFVMTSSAQQTLFEKSGGTKTPTYFEVIDFYKNLASRSSKIKIVEKGMTDAGYPLHVILLDNNRVFDPAQWHASGKVVLMINNGIHPGEPDGIDASLMMVRDYVNGKLKLPDNVVMGIIAVYNIGGALNRVQLSRVSQDGPDAYGFRGNAQNLDLNRDFIKSDSKNARTFAEIFHWLNPDILVDNHVSDGADYPYVMSLIPTQYDKLGPILGGWMRDRFDPELYRKMKERNWDMIPYVNVFGRDPSVGFSMFNDQPRYSTGYAALFNTIAYMPETHMLKPYKQRVEATYDFMLTMIENASEKGTELLSMRKKAVEATKKQIDFPLSWRPDTSKYITIPFMGYTATTKISGLSDLPVLYYDQNQPFTKQVKHFNQYVGSDTSRKPAAYIIPAGWWAVTDLLKLNKVEMQQLGKDTSFEVTVYHIKDVNSMPNAYEKHHKNTSVKIEKSKEKLQFLKNDWIIYTGQEADRFLVETLDPAGQDGYFSWNFFDGIMQQKEGYSDYRWNDIAVEYLNANPELKKEFEEKKKEDAKFAGNLSAQLRWVYMNSPYYEKPYMRYPVYRIE